jgi:hypothetical protein
MLTRDREISRVRNAILVEGRKETVDAVVQNIIFKDDRGVLLSVGATLPSDGDSGYAKGCMFIVSSGGINTTMFVNDGDESACDFNTALGGTGDLTAITTDGVSMIGGGTSGAISPKLGITVKNATGGTLTKGTLVSVTGYSGGYLITKADADAGVRATHVLSADILDTASGSAYAVTVVTGIDTSAGSVGDPLYLSATAGAFTVTAPTEADQMVQKVGVIVTSHASTGSALFFPSTPQGDKIGTTQIKDASVTRAKTNIVEAITATTDGTTTGTISANTTYADVTSSASNKQVILPVPVKGFSLTLAVGANGFDLFTSTPASISLNGGSGAGAKSAIPANSTVFLVATSTTSWKGYYMDADGDLAKVPASA